MYQIESVAEIVQAAGLATLGTDMFLYTTPPEIKNCIILYPSNDPPIVDPDWTPYYNGKFQAIVRNQTYQAGLTLCKSLSEALTVYNRDTPGAYFKQIRPLMQARVYRRSESGLIEFNVTYDVRFIAK